MKAYKFSDGIMPIIVYADSFEEAVKIFKKRIEGVNNEEKNSKG